MKRFLLALILVASLIGGAIAFEGAASYFETLTFAATPASTAITTAIKTQGTVKARAALVSVETQAIRFTVNGSAASATNGHKLAADQSMYIEGVQNVDGFRCISLTDNTAVVKITTYF